MKKPVSGMKLENVQQVNKKFQRK